MLIEEKNGINIDTPTNLVTKLARLLTGLDRSKYLSASKPEVVEGFPPLAFNESNLPFDGCCEIWKKVLGPDANTKILSRRYR